MRRGLLGFRFDRLIADLRCTVYADWSLISRLARVPKQNQGECPAFCRVGLQTQNLSAAGFQARPSAVIALLFVESGFKPKFERRGLSSTAIGCDEWNFGSGDDSLIREQFRISVKPTAASYLVHLRAMPPKP